LLSKKINYEPHSIQANVVSDN